MESEISLKEYWAHVWELLKYLLKYSGIAIAQTFISIPKWIVNVCIKHNLIERADENEEATDYDEEEDEDDVDERGSILDGHDECRADNDDEPLCNEDEISI